MNRNFLFLLTVLGALGYSMYNKKLAQDTLKKYQRKLASEGRDLKDPRFAAGRPKAPVINQLISRANKNQSGELENHILGSVTNPHFVPIHNVDIDYDVLMINKKISSGTIHLGTLVPQETRSLDEVIGKVDALSITAGVLNVRYVLKNTFEIGQLPPGSLPPVPK